MTINPDRLTNLPAAKNWFSLEADDTQDALLNQLIGMVSSAILRSCNRDWLLASNPANPVTEHYSGLGDDVLILNQTPVQSITAIYLDDTAYWGQSPNAFAPATQLVAGSDYALRIDQPDGSSKSGIVLRLNGVWDTQFSRDSFMLSPQVASGRGNIRVVYTAGYNVVPADLEMACLMVMAKARNTRAYGQALQSERDEVYAYSLQSNPQIKSEINLGILGGDVAILIGPYRLTQAGVAL